MEISGASFIAGEWLKDADASVFHAFSPKRHEPIDTQFFEASQDMLATAINEAEKAFKVYRKTSLIERATFLHAIADEIEALGDKLLEVTHEETNLPFARLQGERGRTMNQLRAFAQGLELSQNGIVNLSVLDEADPARAPLAKPRTQLDFIPVGVVAVFGASNFPYAFSTLGGDTASALAAGCPVVMKSHTAHPATSELMTRAIEKAIEKCDMPKGVFSMIQAKKYDMAHALVAAEPVKAVGFTGSMSVASKLIETINTRKETIPFYGELGSINPQFVLPEMAEQNGEELGANLCNSMLMGNGQFCTSPGLWLVPNSSVALVESVKKTVAASSSDTLLSPNILNSFKQAMVERSDIEGVELLAAAELSEAFHANAHIFKTDIDTYLNTPALHEEVFGPAAMLVTFDSLAQLETLIDGLEGQLTASIHGTGSDLASASDLSEDLQYKVGRLIENQMPTGVEVCASMNHGGPFPSSTDVRSTSVGLNAIQRFLRPICRQSAI
ncbi:aldehyde dehydrogenase [Pseudoalteromonas phenolica]|uniref:Aldehyde dehydrogenase n=1 Tax=Pseudoalteromonas phenolica TaxID=161398 RepID=A0A5R9Q704_9GAMM|nr:aldehyde dehydrogenase (NADP(+)) [Pseudoalteromonas phenolica]TLX48442.1 aldehyde dehydrogenase [Pseudoalteromonas phenolica]